MLSLLMSVYFYAAPLPLGDQCRAQCYEKKSTAYQKCRLIPVQDRSARSQCFSQADQELNNCLRECR